MVNLNSIQELMIMQHCATIDSQPNFLLQAQLKAEELVKQQTAEDIFYVDVGELYQEPNSLEEFIEEVRKRMTVILEEPNRIIAFNRDRIAVS